MELANARPICAQGPANSKEKRILITGCPSGGLIEKVGIVIDLGDETLSADESAKYITFMNSQTTEDGIVNSYNLQLAEEYRFITENIELMLTFNV